MTADAFAALVEARHMGNGKWQVRCPAHADRLPSLSIGVGSDGRILLHCLAGCALESEIEDWIRERVRRSRKQP
jgi:hypothetical protein